MHPADLDRGGVLRALRIAGVTILVVLAIALLAIGGLWTFAQTDRGGEIIRRIAVEKVNARIAGQLGGRTAAVRRRSAHAGRRGAARSGGGRGGAGGRRRCDVFILGAAAPARRRAAARDPASRAAARPRRARIRRVESGAGARAGATVEGATIGGSGAERGRPEHRRRSARAGGERRSAHRPLVRARVHVGAIALEGSAHYDGRAQALQTDLRLATEAGRVDAQGAVDLARLRAAPSGFAVRVRELDLAKLMRDTPVTAIDLDVNTRGEHLDADLRASAPGATVSGHGALDEGRVEARAGIEATDLAATARSLARCHLAPPIVLAGRGRIDVALSGPLARPSLRVAGRVPQLTVEHNTRPRADGERDAPAPRRADRDRSRSRGHLRAPRRPRAARARRHGARQGAAHPGRPPDRRALSHRPGGRRAPALALVDGAERAHVALPGGDLVAGAADPDRASGRARRRSPASTCAPVVSG